MNLVQIRHFLALADALNFTRAAAACHVTQPALTKSIRKLEEEFGGSLVLREREHSRLTELGLAMVPLLRDTYEAASAAKRSAVAFHAHERSRLRIGLGHAVPPLALAPLVQALAPKFPKLEISIREGATSALNAWLLEAEIDVALTVDAAGLTERANSWRLFGDEVVVLLGAAHPLTRAAILTDEMLRCEVMIARDEPDVPDACRASPDGAQIRHLASTQEQAWALVRMGQGVALSTRRRAVPSDIVGRPLDPPRWVEVHAAAIPGRPHDPAVAAFLRLARARDWGAAFADESEG